VGVTWFVFAVFALYVANVTAIVIGAAYTRKRLDRLHSRVVALADTVRAVVTIEETHRAAGVREVTTAEWDMFRQARVTLERDL
jgi:hypothetical protein